MSVDFLAAVASRAADGLLPPLSASYARLAAQMTPMERRLLAGDLVLADLDAHAMARELLKDLKHDGDQHDWASRRSSGVLVEPAALSARACASLREAVDTSTFEELDTVDGQLECQLTLTPAELGECIGEGEAAALYAIAARAYEELTAPSVRETMAAVPEWASMGFERPPLALGEPHYILVRRYSAATRPWFPFHYDGSILSMNVALNDDATYLGGELLAIVHGKVRAFARAEGTALVHSSALLHAVARLRMGVRHTLIIFFGRTCPRYNHRLVKCEPEVLRRLYGGQYGGSYHCDRCDFHCDEADDGDVEGAHVDGDEAARDGGSEPMWHCAHWCEYDVCASCHARNIRMPDR